MSKELTLIQPKYDQQTLDLIRHTFCKGIDEHQFKVFIYICQKVGLDPLIKQIYAIPRWDKDLKKNVMCIQTSIDGYRCVAERTGHYAPGRATEYTYDANGQLVSATSFVKKLSKDGTWHEVCATAFYREYAQLTKEGVPTKFWLNMPHSQLGKCAEALALRKAFPADLSGVYTREEMDQAENPSDISIENMQTSDAEIIEPVKEKKFISSEQVDEIIHGLALCAEDFAKNCQTAYFSSCGIDSWVKLEDRFFSKLIAKIYAAAQSKPMEQASA